MAPSSISVKNMETKESIRKKVCSLRRNLSDSQVEKMSRTITEKILSLDVFREARILLVYKDYNHVVMTGYLCERGKRLGKSIALPRVCGKEMHFYPYNENTRLVKSRMGILEPEGETPVIPEDALMIMPGVAFDRERNRIGYGGGYYDRYLALHPELRTVAIAFGFQVFEQVPSEETDIRPEILVTESEIL